MTSVSSNFDGPGLNLVAFQHTAKSSKNSNSYLLTLKKMFSSNRFCRLLTRSPNTEYYHGPSFIIGKIHWWESKATDIHGVICETTKLATSDFGICNFKRSGDYFDGEYGSFRFKPTNSSDEIKCSQLVQTGFLNLKFQTTFFFILKPKDSPCSCDYLHTKLLVVGDHLRRRSQKTTEKR